MYESVKAKVNEKYGSINKLARALGIQSGDFYSAFAGTKPMYPKYKKLIADALGEDAEELFRRCTGND